MDGQNRTLIVGTGHLREQPLGCHHPRPVLMQYISFLLLGCAPFYCGCVAQLVNTASVDGLLVDTQVEEDSATTNIKVPVEPDDPAVEPLRFHQVTDNPLILASLSEGDTRSESNATPESWGYLPQENTTEPRFLPLTSAETTPWLPGFVNSNPDQAHKQNVTPARHHETGPIIPVVSFPDYAVKDTGQFTVVYSAFKDLGLFDPHEGAYDTETAVKFVEGKASRREKPIETMRLVASDDRPIQAQPDTEDEDNVAGLRFSHHRGTAEKHTAIRPRTRLSTADPLPQRYSPRARTSRTVPPGISSPKEPRLRLQVTIPKSHKSNRENPIEPTATLSLLVDRGNEPRSLNEYTPAGAQTPHLKPTARRLPVKEKKVPAPPPPHFNEISVSQPSLPKSRNTNTQKALTKLSVGQRPTPLPSKLSKPKASTIVPSDGTKSRTALTESTAKPKWSQVRPEVVVRDKQVSVFDSPIEFASEKRSKASGSVRRKYRQTRITKLAQASPSNRSAVVQPLPPTVTTSPAVSLKLQRGASQKPSPTKAPGENVLPPVDEGKHQTASTIDIAPPSGQMPANEAPRIWTESRPFAEPRGWMDSFYAWDAPALCHRPLYFEQVNLERYGLTRCGWLQPAASGAHFFANATLIPYLVVAESPHECVYTLGHRRPGSRTCFQGHWPPLSPSGAAAHAGTIGGMIYLIP